MSEISANTATPDLLATHGELQVTYKGVTAPLGALINLCPVDKKDMDPMRIQVWAGSILEESGVDYRTDLAEQGYDVAAFETEVEEAKKKLKQ